MHSGSQMQPTVWCQERDKGNDATALLLQCGVYGTEEDGTYRHDLLHLMRLDGQIGHTIWHQERGRENYAAVLMLQCNIQVLKV